LALNKLPLWSSSHSSHLLQICIRSRQTCQSEYSKLW